MIKRRLGKTNIEVGIIGFGAIPIQRVSKEEAINVVRKSIELGMNFIDTARGYTDSEEKIGEAIKEMDRTRFYIATKGMVTSKEEFERDLKISLENLDTDYVDLYQFHNVNDEERLDKIINKGAYETALKYKEQGVIKHIGITSHSVDNMIKAIETNKFETVQIPFNYVENDSLRLLKRAKELDVGTIIMKPLAGGAFKNGMNSLKWIAKHEEVDVVIPGMATIEEVESNVKVGDDFNLNGEELKNLEEEAESIDKNICRKCGYCMPCPQGINITMIMIMHAYAKRYSMQEATKKRYANMEPNAGACIQCGICESKCPYKLPIMKTMKEVHELLKSD